MEINIYNDSDYEDALWEVDGMHDVYCIAYEKATKGLADKVEAEIGKKLYDELRGYYAENNGFSIRWHTQKYACPTVAGMCTIASLEDYLKGNPFIEHTKHSKKYENMLWDVSDNQATIDYIEENIYIVDYVDICAKVFVCFDASISDKLQLFLYIYPHKKYKLSLTFTEYIKWAGQLRVMQGWQDLFIVDYEAYQKEERPYPFHYFFSQTFSEEKIDLPNRVNEKECKYINLVQKSNYLKRFADSVEALNAQIDKNCEFEIGINPLSIHVIRKVETVLGKSLPDDILAFYLQMNGVELKWEHAKYAQKYKPRASLKMLGINEMFGGYEPTEHRDWTRPRFEGILTFQDSMDEEILEKASKFRLLNNEEFNDVGILFESETPELYVYDKGNYYKISLDFNAYIEKLIENCGIEYWQLFFTNKTDYPDHFLDTCPPVKKAIKSLFSKTDLQAYR